MRFLLFGVRTCCISLGVACTVMILRIVFARYRSVQTVLADDCPICHVPHTHGCPVAEAEAVLVAYQMAHPID